MIAEWQYYICLESGDIYSIIDILENESSFLIDVHGIQVLCPICDEYHFYPNRHLMEAG
jgi:hypothetical protein